MSKSFDEQKRQAFLDYLYASLESASDDVGFDIYAQDVDDWEWLAKLVPGIVIHSAGGMVPFQAEGLINGYPFYYRERGGVAALKVAEKDAKDAYGTDGILWSASEEVQEFRAGPHWIVSLVNLFDRLEKAPFFYEFAGRKTDYSDPYDVESMYATDEPQSYFGWGDSPEEGYAYLMKPSEYLLSVGWSEETQVRLRKLQQISSIPLNEDKRVYPQETPFRVQVPESWRDDEGKIVFPDGFFGPID